VGAFDIAVMNNKYNVTVLSFPLASINWSILVYILTVKVRVPVYTKKTFSYFFNDTAD
jgi:hypothetical protein